jgi:hypothetical protein
MRVLPYLVAVGDCLPPAMVVLAPFDVVDAFAMNFSVSIDSNSVLVDTTMDTKLLSY